MNFKSLIKKIDVLLVPRKQSLNYKDLEPGEIFDIALALKFLTKNLEKFHGCFASTIFVQVFIFQ